MKSRAKENITSFLGGTVLAQKGVLNDFFKGEGSFQGKGIKTLFGTQTGPAGATTAGDLITQILGILLLVAGSLAVVFLVVGGIKYVLSRGNEEQAESAKKTMSAAIWGLVIIIMAYAIVFIVSEALITGGVGI